MINITVGDIEKVTEGKLIYGERDIICENFCRDSREIEPGDTYIGIKGERVDGNTFYEEALKKGATCLILENVNIPDEVLKIFSFCNYNSRKHNRSTTKNSKLQEKLI